MKPENEEGEHLNQMVRNENWTHTIKTLSFDIWFDSYCRSLRDKVLRGLKESGQIKIKRNGKIIWMK